MTNILLPLATVSLLVLFVVQLATKVATMLPVLPA